MDDAARPHQTRRITREEAQQLGRFAWFVFTPRGVEWRTNIAPR